MGQVKKVIESLLKIHTYLEVVKFSHGSKNTGVFNLKYDWNNVLTVTLLGRCFTVKFNTVKLLVFL